MRGLWFIVGGAVVVAAVALSIVYPLASVALLVGVVALIIPRRSLPLVGAVVVLALMILFPVQYLSDFGGLSRVVVAACPTVAVVVFLRCRKMPNMRGGKVGFFALAYVAVLVLSTLLQAGSADASLLWGTLLPAASLAALLLACTGTQVRRLEGIVVLIASMESIYAVAETGLRIAPLWSSSGTADRASQIIPGLVRAQGTLGHPLPLAMLCVVGIALLLRRRHTAPLLRTVTGVGVLSAGIVATGSRSALAIVALMLAFSIGRRIWSVMTVAVLAAGLGALALASGGFFHSSTWVNFVTGDSLSHRNGALDAVPGLLTGQGVGDVLFGNGYFSAAGLFARGLLQQGTFYAIDNQFVTSLVETGLVGVALLIALCVGLWLRAGPYRMLVFGVVAFFFTFDILSWPSAATLFAATLVCVLRHNDDNAPTRQSQAGASESVSSSSSASA